MNIFYAVFVLKHFLSPVQKFNVHQQSCEKLKPLHSQFKEGNFYFHHLIDNPANKSTLWPWDEYISLKENFNYSDIYSYDPKTAQNKFYCKSRAGYF